MGRLAAWIIVTAVMTVVGCASPDRLFSSRSAAAQTATLPESVTVSDGKGGTLNLRLAGVVEGGALVSRFGMRNHPMGGGGVSHGGIDIRAPRGTPVHPAAAGTVVEISWGADFGRFVRLRHSERLDTVYAHLTRVSKPLKVGDTVTPEDIIGQVGSTGRSTGPHLHFEVRRAGHPIDPLPKPVRAKPERKPKPAKTKNDGS